MIASYTSLTIFDGNWFSVKDDGFCDGFSSKMVKSDGFYRICNMENYLIRFRFWLYNPLSNLPSSSR